MRDIVPVRAKDSGVPVCMAIFQGGCYAVDDRGELLGKLPKRSPGWRAFEPQPFRVRTAHKYGGQWIPKKGNLNLRRPECYEVLTDPMTRPACTEVFLDEDGNPQTKEQLLERFGGRYDVRDPASEGPKEA